MRTRTAGWVLWLLVGASCATSMPSEHLVTSVWYLNRSSVPVETEFTSRETRPDGVLLSEGGASAAVPPCDVGGASTERMPDHDQTWVVTVGGSVVITSEADLPTAGAGEALEILVDIPPEGEPTVRALTVPVRPPEDTSRYEELAAALDCG